jgi:hypothetical protein
MSYIGAQPTTAAFITDTFSANGSGTVFTLSAAPANTNSILVAVSGVLQDPSTYSVSGTTLTFSAAPPAGTGNISVRFLGIPASGVVNTAYRTVTEFTATAGQTTFSVPSYTPGFIDVYRNGVRLNSSNYTASNGTTVVLTNAASSGDAVTTESFSVSSVLNAIPATAGAVTDSYILSMAGSKLTGTQVIPKATLPTGSVLQVVNRTSAGTASTTGTSYVATDVFASITPISSTSKILILGSVWCSASANAQNTILTLYRNSTDIVGTSYGLGSIYASSSSVEGMIGSSWLDSPSTTSSTTYTFYVKRADAAGTATAGNSARTSQITLLEIAA